MRLLRCPESRLQRCKRDSPILPQIKGFSRVGRSPVCMRMPCRELHTRALVFFSWMLPASPRVSYLACVRGTARQGRMSQETQQPVRFHSLQRACCRTRAFPPPIDSCRNMGFGEASTLPHDLTRALASTKVCLRLGRTCVTFF